MATSFNKPKASASTKPGLISTALRMKQEADAAIKRGDVSRLKQQGYKFLSFDV